MISIIIYDLEGKVENCFNGIRNNEEFKLVCKTNIPKESIRWVLLNQTEGMIFHMGKGDKKPTKIQEMIDSQKANMVIARNPI